VPGGGTGREEDGSVADEEKVTGGISGPMHHFVNQLRRMTADMESLTGLGGPLPPRTTVPMMPGLPMPGALSAKELNSIATNVKAQRQSIQALQAQLTAFDQQLEVLQGILGPLAEWSGHWAELEELMMNMGRPPKSGA
jgi:hypothetical protein